MHWSDFSAFDVKHLVSHLDLLGERKETANKGRKELNFEARQRQTTVVPARIKCVVMVVMNDDGDESRLVEKGCGRGRNRPADFWNLVLCLEHALTGQGRHTSEPYRAHLQRGTFQPRGS